VVTKAGSYLRLVDFCITEVKAQGPSRTCNESEEEEAEYILDRNYSEHPLGIRGRSLPTGGLDVIRKEAGPSYITISGVRLCWELEEPKGPKGPVLTHTHTHTHAPVRDCSYAEHPLGIRRQSLLK